MEDSTILTYRKKVECKKCWEVYFIYCESKDEEFGHAAQLYVCKECFHHYYHSIQDELYLGKLDKAIENAECIGCSKPLAQVLKKVSFFGHCPFCNSRNYVSLERATEDYSFATNLYH